MFYGHCWDCGQRWELGTASTCVCPELQLEPVQRRFYGYGTNPLPDTKRPPPPPPPPQRKPLSDKELFKIWLSTPAETEDRFAFARAVEAAHGIKE